MVEYQPTGFNPAVSPVYIHKQMDTILGRTDRYRSRMFRRQSLSVLIEPVGHRNRQSGIIQREQDKILFILHRSVPFIGNGSHHPVTPGR